MFECIRITIVIKAKTAGPIIWDRYKILEDNDRLASAKTERMKSVSERFTRLVSETGCRIKLVVENASLCINTNNQ